MYLPTHETVNSSHWVGVVKLTLKALTEEKRVMYVQKRRRDDVRMLEKSGVKRGPGKTGNFAERDQERRIVVCKTYIF